MPKDDEVRVRVHATTVSRTDSALRGAELFISRFVTGLLRPKRRILGSDLAGEVEAVGATVTEFEVGDHVFGINPWKFGTHAEFVCMRASAALALMPSGMSFDEAAAICDGAILALNALRPAELQQGQSDPHVWRLGIHRHRRGAAGPVLRCQRHRCVQHQGLRAREIARSRRGHRLHPGRLHEERPDLRRHPRRRRQPIVQPLSRLIEDRRGIRRHRRVAEPVPLRVDADGDKRVRFPIPPRFTKKDVVFLKELIEAGGYRAVIDRRYPLEQVVEATRYVETKQKTGNVVLTVSRDNGT